MNSVPEEVRVTVRDGVREVCVGIGGMNSSCASISCHLNSVDTTFRNSTVLACEIIST